MVATLLEGGHAYFFHQTFSSYERAIRDEVSRIDGVTLIYLQEAMQAFKAGLHSFIDCNVGELLLNIHFCSSWRKLQPIQHIVTVFANAHEGTNNSFQSKQVQKYTGPPGKTFLLDVKEDLDTNFLGILSIIRNFRNQSGHPTAEVINREQAYYPIAAIHSFCQKDVPVDGLLLQTLIKVPP